MAFCGNSMFGHHLQMAAHASALPGSTFGQRSTGSGFGGNKGFGQGMGSGGFGQSSKMKTDPQSIYNEMHTNPEYMHSFGQHSMFMRQNSLLSEMTQSKDERKKTSAWATAAFSSGNDGGIYPYNIYEKPLEKEEKKAKLERQNTLPANATFGDGEKRRAPSFSSDPARMRGRTISTSSMPSAGVSRPKLSRSISINDDMTVPANMDIAGPQLRRQQSLDAEKALRRNSTSSRKSNRLPFSFGKRRKSVKSVSETDSIRDTISVNSSIPGTPRLRSNTNESRDSAVTTCTDSARSKANSDQRAQEQLILSLMNPEVPDNHESGFEDHIPQSDSNTDKEDKDSPIAVSRRVQGVWESEHNSKPHENKEQSHKPSAPSVTPVVAEATDSETSETFYDCNQNSPASGQSGLRKKRTPRRKRADNSASTCTDGEDTTSTCDTPPRKVTTVSVQPRLYPDPNSYAHKIIPNKNPISYDEADTLKLRQKDPILVAPIELEPKSEILVEPVHVHMVGSDPKDHLIDPYNADSSESGYSTSHRQSAPRDYHQKVTEFVNSLPSKPQVEERHSDNERGVLNGSISDMEIGADHEAMYPKQKLQFGEVKCVSGSDSENESDGDISVSQMEVMKLLDSPNDVRARVCEEMIKKKENNEFNGQLPSPTYLYKKGTEPEEEETLKIISHEPSAPIAETAEKKVDKPLKRVEVKCDKDNDKESENNSENTSETKGHRRPIKSSSSNSGKMFDKIQVARQLSSMYQTNSTSCVNLILHFFNFLLFVTSGAVIGISIWLLLKDFNVNDVTVILGNDLLKIIIFVAISGAGVALIAAFCLCCGMREDKVGLGCYAIVLVAVICSFATSAVLATIFSDKLGGIEFKFHFKDRLETMYNTEEGKETKDLTSAWDIMQSRFQCCGGEGNENGSESWALYQKSQWFKSIADKPEVFVPESCCKKDSAIDICQGKDYKFYGPPRFGPVQNRFFMKNPHLNTDGCYSYFAGYVETLALYITIAAGSLAGIYSIIVMVTWVFCYKKRKDYKYYVDDSYTDYDDETEEVFHETGNRSRHHSENIEETSFNHKPSTRQQYYDNLNRYDVEFGHRDGRKSYSKADDRYNRDNRREYQRYESDPREHRRAPNEFDPRDKRRPHNEIENIPVDSRKAYNRYATRDDFQRYENFEHTCSDIEEGDEETDSDDNDTKSRHSVKSQEEANARRNMWLSSGNTAAFLLSKTIEEEEEEEEKNQTKSPRRK